MTMKSTWKGYVRALGLTVAVKLYKGTEDSESGIALKNIHAGCGGQVGHKNYCKKCGEDDVKSIVKGYELAKDQFTIFSDEELKAIKSQLPKVIDGENFVPAGQISPSYYEQPYFLAPDGEIFHKPYALIRDAMMKSGNVIVSKIVLRDRENLVVVAPLDGVLALYVIRYHAEVRQTSEIPHIDAVVNYKTSKDLLSMAIKAMNAKSVDFKEVREVDTYVEQMKVLIQAKIDKKDFTVPDSVVKDSGSNDADIMNLLALSIAEQTTKAKKAEKPAKAKARKAS